MDNTISIILLMLFVFITLGIFALYYIGLISLYIRDNIIDISLICIGIMMLMFNLANILWTFIDIMYNDGELLNNHNNHNNHNIMNIYRPYYIPGRYLVV